MSPSRRKFLQLMSASGTAAMFGKLLEPSVAEAQTPPPLRFVAIASLHGKDRQFWDPKGTGETFNIDFAGATLRPLQPYRSRLLIPLGLDYQVLIDKTRTGHNGGPATCFTGRAPVADSYYSTVGGPSLDVLLGNRLGADTAVRSVQISNHADYCGDDSYLSFSDTGQKLPNIAEPRALYDRLFGGFTPPGMVADPRVKRRGLVDYWLKDANRLRGRLAGPEQQKLDSHLAGLRDIERRIEATAPPPVSCAPPSRPRLYGPEEIAGCFSPMGELLIPERTRLMIDILAQALACGRTRYAALRLSPGLMGKFDTFLADPMGADIHNALAHQMSASTDAAARLNRVQTWNSEMVAYLLSRLEAVPEASGTLLDHSLVLWGNELSDPSAHNNNDMPYVLAGGGNGKIRTGRSMQFPRGTPHNRLLCAVANAFDLNLSGFGDAAYSGALSLT